MCGIVGISGFRDDTLVEKMCQSLVHRGPDAIGTYFSNKVSLGHTRLSIIDLNDISNQPMSNYDNSLHIVYNGELYNFINIKNKLIKKGYSFKTLSDTEVVLYAYEEWGSDCLNMFNGMFSFAINDERKNLVFIARDRAGIKPLYFFQKNGKILFSSEIKSLLNFSECKKSIDEIALRNNFIFRYTSTEKTFFKNIKKFPPGYYGIIKNGTLKKYQYWNVENFSPKNNNKRFEDYFEEFSYLLEDSVQKRLVSDVPFGMYLSGGIDSTVILSIMNKYCGENVNTYSIDFIPSIGEGAAASKIASEFNTNHHEINISEEDLDLFPQIVKFLDEPQGDAIILPSYKLSLEASKDVKMVLTGEGADEIFTGYQFFKSVHYIQKYRYLTQLIRSFIKLSPNFLMNWLSNHPANFQNKSKNRILNTLFDDNINFDEKLNGLISLFDKDDIKKLLLIPIDNENQSIPRSYSMDRMQKQFFGDWLPNNILWRQDRMTMANSIEGRVPFLDHRLVEFAFMLPEKYKINRFIDKYILRQYCNQKIKFYNSRLRKKPFYIPLQYYMTTDTMNDFISTYLTKEKIEQAGILSWNFVEQSIKNKNNLDFLFSKQLFSILMFQMWYESYIEGN